MKLSPSIDLEFIGSYELPEQNLAVAVIERAVCDFKCSNVEQIAFGGYRDPERVRDYIRRTAASFLFQRRGKWSLEWYCAWISDDPEDLARRVRRYCLSNDPFLKKRAHRR